MISIRRQTALSDAFDRSHAPRVKLCLAVVRTGRVVTGSSASETAQGIKDAYTADYELGYDNGFATALAGKPADTTGVADEPVSTKNPYGRSAHAYKAGYSKGYQAGKYQKDVDNSSGVLSDLPAGVDPSNPKLPPPPTAADLKLPPLGDDAAPKLGDQPKDTSGTATAGGFVFMMGLALVVVAGIYFATKVT